MSSRLFELLLSVFVTVFVRQDADQYEISASCDLHYCALAVICVISSIQN